MANHPTVRDYVAGILAALTMAIGCMAIFIAVVFMAPAAAPALWLGVPVGTIAGMLVIHRRFPADTYVIGIAFVPVVATLLGFAAFQVYWSVLGDSL
jgi:hypothetical protein